MLGIQKAHALAVPNPINCEDFPCVVQALTAILVNIAIPLAAIFLIYGGFLFVAARGDEQQLKSAKDIFWYTIIGTAIVVGAYAIASAVVFFAKTV
jgi:nitrate reductase gamma subunit